MVELVDTRDLKSRETCSRAGSTPALGTRNLRAFRITPESPFSIQFDTILPPEINEGIRYISVPLRTVSFF